MKIFECKHSRHINAFTKNTYKNNNTAKNCKIALQTKRFFDVINNTCKYCNKHIKNIINLTLLL